MSDTAFVRTLTSLISHVSLLPHANTVEVELRVTLTEEQFEQRFAQFAHLALTDEIKIADSISSNIDIEFGKKLRTERCFRQGCVLESVVKTRILEKPIDFTCNVGRLRIDAQRETSSSSVVDLAGPGIYTRYKTRLSFTFADALAWRVDFTRVSNSDNRKQITYELEVELTHSIIPDASAIELAEMGARVLKRLNVVILNGNKA